MPNEFRKDSVLISDADIADLLGMSRSWVREERLDRRRGHPHRTSYLTTTEAANYIRMSKQFLEIARHRGDGPPYIKLSRAVRYHRPSLDDWMLERQRNHTAEGEA